MLSALRFLLQRLISIDLYRSIACWMVFRALPFSSSSSFRSSSFSSSIGSSLSSGEASFFASTGAWASVISSSSSENISSTLKVGFLFSSAGAWLKNSVRFCLYAKVLLQCTFCRLRFRCHLSVLLLRLCGARLSRRLSFAQRFWCLYRLQRFECKTETAGFVHLL